MACWLGARRVTAVSDPRMFFDRHLQYLEKHKIDVDRVTMVFSIGAPEHKVRALEIMQDYKDYYTELKIVFRENKNFSYGAWNDVLNECMANNEDFTHYFLVEDDYAPGRPDFLDVYESQMAEGVGYVCQKISHETLSELFNTQPHPGICCGLLLGQAARDAYEKFGTVLEVERWSTTRYDYSSLRLQIHFMDNVVACGYGFADTYKVSSIPFVLADIYVELSVMEFGDPSLPRALEPVVEWALFERGVRKK